jgi:hypothetical protein
MPPAPTSMPSAGRAVRTLKDGYWDRTEVIERLDGSFCVRKRNRLEVFGPWGVESLRREIHYLTRLPPAAAVVFPPVLACWDRESEGGPDIGYEMPYYRDHRDAGALAREGVLAQDAVEHFQRELAEAVLNCLHQPATAPELLSRHVVTAIRQAVDELSKDAALSRLIAAPRIELNGRPALGLRAALERIVSEAATLTALDGIQSVQLHGDLFLENILWRATSGGNEPRLVLVDPVSVAGIAAGPPLFDLVKYQSYATGELFALRTECVEVSGIGAGDDRYRWRIRWEDPSLAPFRERDWHSGFRRAFVERHGEPDTRLYRLIDGYFSAAMALNTTGLQRQARLLKATEDLNAVLK